MQKNHELSRPSPCAARSSNLPNPATQAAARDITGVTHDPEAQGYRQSYTGRWCCAHMPLPIVLCWARRKLCTASLVHMLVNAGKVSVSDGKPANAL